MAISNGPLSKPRLTLPEVPGQRQPKVITSPTIAALGPDGRLTVKPREGEDGLNPRRQPDSGSRGPSEKGGRSENSSKLSRDPGDRASETAVKDSSQPTAEPESPAIILQGLMDKFIFLKENGGKAEAFKQLQKSFAAHAAILSPYFIPLKDLMNLIMELETFIGRSGEHVGKTPEQVMRGFLQTGYISDIKVESPYKTVDKSS